MIKCKNAKRYQAKRAPKCNNNQPCTTCLEKWSSRFDNNGKIIVKCET